MTDHKPTAKAGIRGSNAGIQEFLPQADQTATVRVEPETTLLNTVQTPANSKPDTIFTSFSEGGLATEFGDNNTFAILINDVERVAAIREALFAHRAMLIGLKTRKENEGSLNPASREGELDAISRGILRAETLLSEFELVRGVEQEA